SVTLTASSPEQRPQLIFGIRTERVCSISDITWVLRDSRVGFLTYCGTGKRLPAQARQRANNLRGQWFRLSDVQPFHCSILLRHTSKSSANVSRCTRSEKHCLRLRPAGCGPNR